MLRRRENAGKLVVIGGNKTMATGIGVSSGAQHERPASWLAAMLECEGTFTFQYNEQVKNGKLQTHIQPRVIFVNSDFAMVDAVKDTGKQLGVDFYDHPVPCGGLGKKPKRELQYNGFKCLPLLKLLLPEMVGAKREVVRCMIAFIEYRQSLKDPKQKYGDYEFELLRRVREVNSGQWKNKPKFALISTEAVKERREAVPKVS